MDCSKEGDDDGAISELDRLEEAQPVLRRIMVHVNMVCKCRRGGPFEVQIPAQVDCTQGCRKVGQSACKTEQVGLPWHFAEIEGILDNVLSAMCQLVYRMVSGAEQATADLPTPS